MYTSSKGKGYMPKYPRYDEPNYDSDSSEDYDGDNDSEIVRPTLKSHTIDRKYKDHRYSTRPTLGLAIRNKSRSHTIDTFSSATTYSSAPSSPLETTTETNEMDDASDLYTPIPYNKRSPVRHLVMDEEISPVQKDKFRAPYVPSLIKGNFRPTMTSTATDLKKLYPVPKTNPHMGSTSGMMCSTPRSGSSRAPLFPLTTYADVLHMEESKRQQRPKSYYGTSTPSFWDNTKASSLRSIPETVNSGFYRPENFGMHAAYARNRNTKGIVFLTMTVAKNILSVTIHNAVYFMEIGQPPVCSFVQAELRKKDKDRHDQRKRHNYEQKPRERTQSFRTELVPSTNKPEFRTTFKFNLKGHQRGSTLFICVWAMSAEHSGFNLNTKKMQGCMTFPTSRLLEKVRSHSTPMYEEDDENMFAEEVVVNEGGFFLLDSKDGQRNNLPQSKVNKTEFYDDPALSGTCGGMTSASYSSSNLTSSHQMPIEEFVKASRGFGSSMVPGYSSASIEDLPHHHDFTTSASSSSASRDASGFSYHGQHRATLPCVLNPPSITTTNMNSGTMVPWQSQLVSAANSFFPPVSPRALEFAASDTTPSRALSVLREVDDTFVLCDTTTSEHDIYGGASSRQDFQFLHVHSNNNICPVSADVKKDIGVRRAASFTFSPKGAADKHNKRPVQAKLKEEEKEKRKNRGPISKTISYIRSKMDTALSTTSLYASKEEIRQWETCFEALLNHKFGCSLFRQFLKKEFSDENVDFWLDCEDFKKMKDGKKATTQRAHDIYREYVAEQAPKEVNLDSDTRAATKAALENGCRTDTFSLAQSRIEQLMEKDSYRRFLKDPLYTELLKSLDNGETENTTTTTS